jgi:PAS domain S-box-containing protein
MLGFLAKFRRPAPAATQSPSPDPHRAAQCFRHLVESADAVFWVVSADNREVRYVSPGFERIWGGKYQSLYCEPGSWLGAVHAEDRERVAAELGGPIHQEVEVQYRIVRPTGAIRWLRDRIAPLPAEAGAAGLLMRTTEDITDYKLLKEQMHQAQKQEVIGRMAGGLAHDLNNILTIILSCGELLLQGQAVNCTPEDLVEQILQSTRRAATLTRQLLGFSRKQILMPRILSLNVVIEDIAHMIQRLIGEDVELVLDLQAGLCRIEADPSQMDQVLLNLAANSRDAMPGGGRLTIRTENASGEDPAGLPPGIPPGRYAVLSVTDSGHGMDEATIAHIFEPFFTTKGPDKGTGLGLAIIREIVKQFDAHITVCSTPGQGTTFRIYFQALEGAAETVTAVPPRADDRCRARGTVLVAEDDDELRPLVRNILSRTGYTVLEARHAAEALTLAEHHPGPIQVLLTDVVMPGLNGPELAQRLRQFRPDVKVLYTSGYPSDAVLRWGVGDLNTAFLHKPFTPSLLREKVGDILSQGSQAVPREPDVSVATQPK